MALALARPEIPACEDCGRWLYDKDWKQSRRAGKPVPRPAGVPTPCALCPKSAGTGRPNPAAELSGRNAKTLALYHQAKAGLPVPADPIARRNLGVIERVTRQVERQQSDPLPLLLAMFSKGT